MGRRRKKKFEEGEGREESAPCNNNNRVSCPHCGRLMKELRIHLFKVHHHPRAGTEGPDKHENPSREKFLALSERNNNKAGNGGTGGDESDGENNCAFLVEGAPEEYQQGAEEYTTVQEDQFYEEADEEFQEGAAAAAGENVPPGVGGTAQGYGVIYAYPCLPAEDQVLDGQGMCLPSTLVMVPQVFQETAAAPSAGGNERTTTETAGDLKLFPDEEEAAEIANTSTEVFECFHILNSQLRQFMDELLPMVEAKPSLEDFSRVVDDISSFLATSINILPGPKHPASKKDAVAVVAASRNNSDPLKNNSRAARSQKPVPSSGAPANNKPPQGGKGKRPGSMNAQYNYELIQHLYQNSRKQVARFIMANIMSTHQCPLPKETIYEYLTSKWDFPNSQALENYGPSISPEQQEKVDADYSQAISAKDIYISLKSTKLDSGPGLDRVTVRSIKATECATLLATVGTVMQKWGLVPRSFRDARTLLFWKGNKYFDDDDEEDRDRMSNYRIVSICSVLRRVIERVLERRLRQFIHINENQLGFNLFPSLHISSSILRFMLERAKREGSNLFLLFLDISSMYEELSHEHLCHILNHTLVPSSLRALTKELLRRNASSLQAENWLSDPIPLRRGLLQGLPLSHLEMNLSLRHVHEELSEKAITSRYGVELHPKLSKFTNAGFPHDIAIASGSLDGIRALGTIALHNLNKVGYNVHPEHSQLISVRGGLLVQETLSVTPDFAIQSIDEQQAVKYLGHNFHGDFMLGTEIRLEKLDEDLQKLVETPMLKPDQKLGLIKQYVWPWLVCPLESIPPSQIPFHFLESVNQQILRATKAILGLDPSVPNQMLYTSRKHRGLETLNSYWEVWTRHIETCLGILNAHNKIIPHVRNCRAEIKECADLLNVSEQQISSWRFEYPRTNIRVRIKSHLQERQFEQWTMIPVFGEGVAAFQQSPYGNTLITEKVGITSSEWVSAIRMATNAVVLPQASAAAAGGSSTVSGELLPKKCRNGSCSSPELLPHILDSCPKGDRLRRNMYAEVRGIIAKHLRAASGSYIVEEELQVSSEGALAGIILCVAQEDGNEGYVLELLIRWESQWEEAAEEPNASLAQYREYLEEKFHCPNIQTVRVLLGSRATISDSFERVSRQFYLPKSMVADIVIAIVRSGFRIAYNHFYHA